MRSPFFLPLPLDSSEILSLLDSCCCCCDTVVIVVAPSSVAKSPPFENPSTLNIHISSSLIEALAVTLKFFDCL